MRSWLVRLGKYGEMEPKALETGELVTGWRLGSLKGATNKDAILPVVAQAQPDQKPGTLTNWAVQLNQFINVMKTGDLEIVPMKTTGQLAIGKVASEWFQTPEGNPSRKVEWLRNDLPRQAVKQDLLYSLGATQTVCEISRNEATRRFMTAASKGVDPGPVGVSSTKAATAQSESVEAADAPLDLALSARDQIESYISAHFTGHAFTRLVAEILRAQGYQVHVSPPGADKGVDIVAGQGALGFDGPRLVVQVKSGDIVIDQPTRA
jgi:restriction system protein